MKSKNQSGAPKATVRDLRYRFPEIEARLSKGEPIEIHKRHKLVARLVPIHPSAEAYPDFGAVSRRIFRNKKTRTSGTDLVSQERGEF